MTVKQAGITDAVQNMGAVTRCPQKALNKGKARRVGRMEAITLRLAGTRDGKHGFPRQDEEGNWTSPVLSQECHSFTEFCDKTWGKTQLNMAGKYSRLGFLLKELAALESNLKGYQAEMEITGSGFSAKRRNGEESLPESIVRVRREQELLRALGPLKKSVHECRSAITKNLREANVLEHEITEVNNATRLACERVMEHTRQRADVYWRSAAFHHREKNSLPAVPRLRLIPAAELTYFRQHALFLEEAKSTIAYLSIKYDVTCETEEKGNE